MKETAAGKTTRKKTVKFYVGIAILTLTVMIGGSVPYLLLRGGWGNRAGQQTEQRAPRPARAEERRGVWVAYLSLEGVDREGIDKIVADTKAAGLNTIFFHVRPFGDALYDSDYYPWSHLVTGTQGQAPEDGFDPLAYAVEAAHREGMYLHAWLNPLRIMLPSGTYPPSLSDDNPYTVWR
ncbi:MAG: family 10 glycosylhydrolase, partial [Clostridia bacterium]|nr:family 10 glycosylhydrolase [Clostridia bacterium]